MMNKQIRLIFLPLIFSVLFISCSSNEDSTDGSTDEIDLNEAKLTEFPFMEFDNINIQISQPTIENNEELTEGEILITLPHTVTSLLLTLKSVNIDTNKFNIFPSVGIQELFSETDFVKYTITTKNDLEKKTHYNIKIIIAPTPEEEKLSITNFELLSNDNNAYTNIDLIKESNLQTIDSLIVCLFPAPVNYSDLKPVITYEGSKIEYRVNDEIFREYPVNTTEKIDFKYPNTVDFKISNTTNSKSILYRVIIDTEHPIVVDESEITIPDLQIGNSYNSVGVATWTNRGNYPITTMSPNGYFNVITPVAGLNNIFTLTLSKNTTGNINPDESGIINVAVTNTPLVGEYEAIALFTLNFNENSWEITNSPRDNYISDFGPKEFYVRIKGTIIN